MNTYTFFLLYESAYKLLESAKEHCSLTFEALRNVSSGEEVTLSQIKKDEMFWWDSGRSLLIHDGFDEDGFEIFVAHPLTKERLSFTIHPTDIVKRFKENCLNDIDDI